MHPAPLVMWSDLRWAFHIKVEWSLFPVRLGCAAFSVSPSLERNLPQCARTEDQQGSNFGDQR